MKIACLLFRFRHEHGKKRVNEASLSDAARVLPEQVWRRVPGTTDKQSDSQTDRQRQRQTMKSSFI